MPSTNGTAAYANAARATKSGTRNRSDSRTGTGLDADFLILDSARSAVCRASAYRSVGHCPIRRRLRRRGALAFVPAREREARKQDRNSKQPDAGNGNQQQRCEKTRNVELKSGEQNLIGEPCAAAAGSGDKL